MKIDYCLNLIHAILRSYKNVRYKFCLFIIRVLNFIIHLLSIFSIFEIFSFFIFSNHNNI